MAADPDLKRGYTAGVAAYLTWGLLPLYWKLIHVPAIQVTLWRMTQGAILSAGYLWLFRSRSPLDLFADRRARLIHLVTALLLGGNWLVYVYSIATDRVVESSLGYFINPLISVALGMVFLGEKLSRNQAVAVGIALVGLAVLTIEAGSIPWISLVLALTFAFYGLIRKTSPLGPIEGMATETLWMLPPSAAALAYLASTGRLEFGGPTSAAAIGVLGIMTLGPLLLFTVAARALPLSTVGLMQYMAPSIQFALGVVAFGEAVSTGRWIGSGLIWLALAVLAVDSLVSYRARTLARSAA